MDVRFHATGDITRVVILLYAIFQSSTVFLAMPKMHYCL